MARKRARNRDEMVDPLDKAARQALRKLRSTLAQEGEDPHELSQYHFLPVKGSDETLGRKYTRPCDAKDTVRVSQGNPKPPKRVKRFRGPDERPFLH